MKLFLIPVLLSTVLAGCGGDSGGDSGGGSQVENTDEFLDQVQALLNTEPEDTEQRDYSSIEVSTSENSEPLDQ